MNRTCFFTILIAVFFVTTAQAMVYDNRFFPLIVHPYITVPGRPSHMQLDFFATTANQSIDAMGNDVGLPVIFGEFDQAQWGQAIIEAGKPNFLRPDWLAAKLPWSQEGKIQSQGISLWAEQHLWQWFSAGISALFMRVESSRHFTFNPRTATAVLGPGDVLELDQIRRDMNRELCLDCNHWSHTGFGDIDLFLRSHCRYDYLYKFRSIIAGARLGVLVPTGVKRDIDNPASVPFGGNGHWGIYGALDAEFEIKEDWKLGFLGRISKRFARTLNERLPVGTEPDQLGVIVGQVRVNPGLTGVFSTYFSMENLREGFGLRAQYTLIDHQHDSWTDERCDRTVPIRLCDVEEHSGWASEYITLTAFYDFGKLKRIRSCEPIVNLSWDIPCAFLVAHRTPKTFKVSLGVEFNW